MGWIDNAKSEKRSIFLTAISMCMMEVILVGTLIRHWHALSALTCFWYVYLGGSFAFLWFDQLHERGKKTRLLSTALTFMAAVMAILGPH